MKSANDRIVVAVLAAGLVLACAASADAATCELKLAVKVAAAGGKDVPVCAKIDLPAALATLPAEKISAALKPDGAGPALAGQIARRDGQAELWWILPEAAPGTQRWTAVLSDKPYEGKDVFGFRDEPGKHVDVLFAGRPITRYVCAFDRSTKARIFETYKPFHHVFDLAGKDVITKDPHGHDPHHRGIYIGWGSVSCGGKRYNFWSMSGGVAQVHRKFLARTAGPVLARATALVEWIDKDGKVIVSEQRETTCFRQPPPTIMLMEFHTILEPVAGDVALGGNAEHGGFQYRPHNDVAVQVGAARGKQTADKARGDLKTRYEFHAEGIKTPQQRLNGNKDLPWAAQSYALRKKRYSVQHMNHKSNPSPTIYSAYRQYGRFGAFFKKTIAAGEALPLSYRIYAAERTMPPRDEMNCRHAAFNNPPQVTVVK